MSSIAVVTPTIPGREDFLEQCRRSVKAQSVEVPHYVAIDSNRDGPSTVRNALVDLVETDYVVFLDDDDLLDSDFIESIRPHLGQYDVVYPWCRVEGMDVAWQFPFNEKTLRIGNYIPITAAVKRETFLAVGGFKQGIAYEDWRLWLDFLDRGAKFKNVPEVRWTYRIHAGSRGHANNDAVGRGEIAPV